MGSNFVLLHATIQLSQYHLLQQLSPSNGLHALVKNQLAIYVKVYFWTLSSIPLVRMSFIMPVPHSLIIVGS